MIESVTAAAPKSFVVKLFHLDSEFDLIVMRKDAIKILYGLKSE